MKRGEAWFGLSTAIVFIAGIGFFFLSTIALGVLPGLRLEHEIRTQAPASEVAYTPAQARGRQIYATEGCAYCHSQQVRHTAADVRRWGPPTQAWETKYNAPQLWGTRRIGPDLAREAGVRSNDWQRVHLFNPRDVVPGSVMPGYPWMFDGSASRPKREALDLLAYLDTLGKARIDAAAKAPAHSAMARDMLNNPSAPRVASPGRPMRAVALRGHGAQGKRLFAQYCSGCHGRHGDGRSEAARAMRPRPADLTAFRYDTSALIGILRNGVAGTAMPAWRDLSDQQLADLSVYVQQLQRKPAVVHPSPAQVARGATLYAGNCTVCHGVGGGGDGPAARTFTPRPFDFRHLRPAADEIERVVRDGVPGSAMPAFPGMNGADRAAVAAYVRSLYGDPDDEHGQ